jgi:hypothetical protein
LAAREFRVPLASKLRRTSGSSGLAGTQRLPIMSPILKTGGHGHGRHLPSIQKGTMAVHRRSVAKGLSAPDDVI